MLEDYWGNTKAGDKMDTVQRQPVLIGLGAFILGFIVGLFIFGWGLTPVEWTGGGPQHLSEVDQELYLLTLSRYYALTGDQELVQNALGRWEEAPEAICAEAAERRPTTPVDADQLESLARVFNPQGCAVVGQPDVEEDADGLGGLLTVLLLLVLLIVIAGAFLYFLRRPTTPVEESPGYLEDMATAGPATVVEPEEGFEATPIARFETTYTRGHDTYDDSFSIENAQGDFLGECGVGISESIGMDTPKNVTAFEVWLFDKNDIRTVTKVIMSDHAFFDEALKAKLAPKGEPVLAREGETIVLETETLIINAEITDMEYGEGNLPPKSFFERFTAELSAWAKEGEFEEPDIQGHIDDMLDF